MDPALHGCATRPPPDGAANQMRMMQSRRTMPAKDDKSIWQKRRPQAWLESRARVESFDDTIMSLYFIFASIHGGNTAQCPPM